MKKSILSLLLAVVLTFGATQSVISAFAESKRNEDTPIAQISNDNYESVNERTNKTIENQNAETAVQAIKDCTEYLGGEVCTFESEDEYNCFTEKETNKIENISNTYSRSTTEIKKTFKVLDRKTSKPISNAIVRLNGIPRYTDRNGEINVTLTDSVYELYVEKNIKDAKVQYNPHIEFLYLEDEEDSNTVKTVYLKRPCDDLEIYAVNLRIGSAYGSNPEFYNLLEQEYYFALDYMNYPADIILETNKTPDFSCLYVNGNLDRLAVGNDFVYFDYNKLKKDGTPFYSPDDEFSISFVYEGIESEQYKLHLKFSDLKNVKAPTIDLGDGVQPVTRSLNNGLVSGGPTPDQDMGLGANCTVDLVSFAKYFAQLFDDGIAKVSRPKKWGSINPTFTATYNPKKNTMKIVVGFSYQKDIKKTGDKINFEKYKDAVELSELYEPELNDLRNQVNTAQDNLSHLKEDKWDTNKNQNEIARQLAEYERARDNYAKAAKEYNEGYYYQTMSDHEYLLRREFDNNADKLSNLAEQIRNGKDAVSALKRELGDLKEMKYDRISNNIFKGSFKFDFQFKVLGTYEFEVTTKDIQKFDISGMFHFGLSYTKHFMAGYVPVYLRAAGSLDIGVKFEFYKDGAKLEKLADIFTFFIKIVIRGDAGVGLYDYLSVGAFLSLTFDFQFKFGSASDKSFGKFALGVGVRVKLLFFEWEFKFPDAWGGEPLEWYMFGGDKKENQSNTAKLMSRSYNLQHSGNTFDSVYQDSKPQLMDIGDGKYILVWLRDSIQRDAYNRTELVYSIFDGNEWSEVNPITSNSNTADFNPELYKRGSKIYLTWQRLNNKLTENDTLYDMTSKSEIWFSEFDFNSLTFGNSQRITNDSTMDLAPKFAISNNENDDLILIWQKNTANDMLGMEGINSIVYSTYCDSSKQWSESKIIYSSENIISYVTGAMQNGQLLVSFVEDLDKDLLTSEDRIVKVLNSNNEEVYSTSSNVGSTQFVDENGEIMLYYYDNGNIVKTNLKTKENVITCTTDDFNSGFKVVSNKNGTVIFYSTTDGERKQSYCVIYDSIANKWSQGVKLSQCLDNADMCTGFLTESGDIAYAHIVYDDKQSYASIDFGEKKLNYSVEIKDAYFLGSLVDGEKFELALTVKNTGDFEFNQIKISLFGQEHLIELGDSLLLGETRTLFIDFFAKIQGKTNDTISCDVIINDQSFAQYNYTFFFGYVDYCLDSELIIIDATQVFKVNIINLSNYVSDGKLIVYINGEITQEIELKDVCKNGTEIIEITFTELLKGDFVYVEFVSDSEEVYLNNNSCAFSSTLDNIIPKEAISNPYADILSLAKGAF